MSTPEVITNSNSDVKPQNAKKSKRGLLVIVFLLTALVFTGIGAGIYWLITDSKNDTTESSSDKQDVAEDTDDISEDENDTTTNESDTDDVTETEIYENWECDTTTNPEYLNITGDGFTISINDAGRGPYCGDGPDPDNSCTTKTFYENDKTKLTSYYLDGNLGEIFGGFAISKREKWAWIGITYEDKNIQELTEEQKDQLIQFIDSIEIK